jgi:hypothetical protein
MNKTFKVGDYVKHTEKNLVGLILCEYSRSYLVECDNGDEVWYKNNVIEHDIKYKNVVDSVKLNEHRKETKEIVVTKSKYPVLMRDENRSFIVLFTSHGKGMVIQDNCSSYPVGFYSESWYMPHFELCNTKITLENGDD